MTIVEQIISDLEPMIRMYHQTNLADWPEHKNTCQCGWRPAHQPRSVEHWGRVMANHVDRKFAEWHDRIVDLAGGAS